MQNWTANARYRGKAVGLPSVQTIGTTGTRYVEVNVEGPGGMLIRYRGYINTRANTEATVAELRAMGWKGRKLGDWQGIGSVEFTFAAMPDVNGDKTYWRAAFIQSAKPQASPEELAQLNEEFGDLFAGGLDDDAPPAPAGRVAPPASRPSRMTQQPLADVANENGDTPF